MFKNTLKRLGAIIMVLAMAMSVMMVSAFATDAETVKATQEITITKTISKEDNVLTPAGSYVFTIAPTATGSLAAGQYAGEMNAISDSSKTIAFTQGGSNVGSATFTITAANFSKPGTYSYTVTEAQIAGQNINGMSLAGSKTMIVYVTQVNGVNSIAAVVVDGQEQNKSALDFVNTYTTNNLTVSKTIDGNQANLGAKWKFEITIAGPTGETYATSNSAITLNANQKTEIELGNGDSLTIYGLSATDTYTVTEVGANTDGYVTTINTEASNGTATGDTANGDVSLGYKNYKNNTIPTGVIMNIAPYVLMVALAGGIAFFFLRRRHAE